MFYKIIKNLNLRNCFLITSSGCAATRWLAASLSSHPEIVCSGGAGELKDTMDFYSVPTAEHAEEIAQFLIFHQAGADPKPKRFAQLFLELKQYRAAKFYGNIHFFTIGSLFDQKQFDFLPSTLPIANLVRHPITRLETHYQHWKNNYLAGSNCRKLFELCLSGFEYRFPELKEHFLTAIPNLENDSIKRIFMYSFFDTLHSSLGDFRTEIAKDIPFYRMEDLKTQPHKLFELIKFITKNKLEVNSKYLNAVYSEKNMKVGRFTGKILLNEAEQYVAWENWQKIIFKKFLDFSELTLGYNRLNYNFDFI